jgi:hypothetical protein
MISILKKKAEIGPFINYDTRKIDLINQNYIYIVRMRSCGLMGAFLRKQVGGLGQNSHLMCVTLKITAVANFAFICFDIIEKIFTLFKQLRIKTKNMYFCLTMKYKSNTRIFSANF